MYKAAENRYEAMEYKRSGRSGVLLPRISLGLWQNFGLEKPLDEQKEILFRAFDMGITHFDLANNYGHPANGMAEENFGAILKSDLGRYSLDSSLKRMGLDYVDVFYHHRPDPETPLEETMGALSDAVRQGKALYVGISNYKKEEAEKAIKILRDNHTPCLLHQPRYNMLDRWVEDGLLGLLDREGVGCICFSPLAQGALTNKYLHGIPQGSRASREGTSISGNYLTEEKLAGIRELDCIAKERNQTLAQMALAWILRRPEVTSVLVGASSCRQLEDNVAALKNTVFGQEELARIEQILAGIQIK